MKKEQAKVMNVFDDELCKTISLCGGVRFYTACCPLFANFVNLTKPFRIQLLVTHSLCYVYVDRHKN